MKKNVASQAIGAQMISATDGSEFTGAVTVLVTGDAGTQATGSVGSGACTHEGHGFHTYAPAQAETNYDHIAFTFIGTGAVPVTVQLYTTFPQTGDNFARLGAPAGASLAADVAALKTVADAIKVPTDKLTFTVANQIDANVLDWKSSAAPAMTGDAFARLGAPAGASVAADVAAVKAVLPAALVSGRIDASVGAMAANVMTAAAAAADLTTELQTGLATATAVSTLQTSVDDLPTNAELATALGTADDAVLAQVALVKAKTDNLPSDPADASDIAAAFSTVNSTLGTIAGYVDTEVGAIKSDTAAIKLKTDNLPASPAATGDIPSAAAISDAVWDEALSGHAGAGSAGEALSAAAGGGTAPTATEIADAVLTRQFGDVDDSGGDRDLLHASRFIRNGFSISGATLTVLKEDDTTAAYTRTLTSDAGAEPIVGVA